MKTTLSIVVTVVFLVVSLAKASTDTNGANGINSTGLTVNGQPLNGSGVSIGQVESYRAGKKNDPDTTEYNDHVTPFKVFDNVGLVPDSLGPPGGDNGIHAETVASVMISTDPTDPDGAGPRTPPTGVAPGARLLSIAAGVGKSFMPDQAQQYFAESSQAIVTYAKTNFTDAQQIRAINMSIGVTLSGNNPAYDGNSTLTEYVDWSAQNDDILYVVAGNELDENNNPLIGVPADNFNGMTIAESAKDNATGKYSVVAQKNVYSGSISGGRSWVSLMAPGENVDVDSLGVFEKLSFPVVSEISRFQVS